MPDADLRIRLVTLNEALDEMGRNPRPFLLINIERHPRGIPMPNQRLLERLREDCDDDLLIVPAPLAELDAALPLCRDRDRFCAGEFVLMKATQLHETLERPHGGQDVAGLEERARDGLYVTVAMVTERLRACADHEEGRKMATETRRGEIFETLQPLLANLSVRNCFDAGQRRIAAWYPGSTAYQAMKSAYVGVLEQLRNGAKPVLVKAEQLELVRTAHAIYAKTEELLKAQHEMSAELRKMMESNEFVKANPEAQHGMQAKFLRERALAQHQELAHNKQGGPSLAQVMPAAAAMDLNPSSAYANFLFYKSELDCAMLLGRVERGFGVMLGSKHIKALKRFRTQADEAEGEVAVDAEIEAARCLRALALRVRTRAGWEEFFSIAEADGREYWMSKTL